MGAEKQRTNSTDIKDVNKNHDTSQISPKTIPDDMFHCNISSNFPVGNGYGRARRDSAYGSTSTYNSATSPIASVLVASRTTDNPDHQMYNGSAEVSPSLGTGGSMGFQDIQFDMYPPTPGEQNSDMNSDLNNPDRDWPVLCLMPNCEARPFRRNADLKRHYNNAHPPANVRKDTFHCDYPKCARLHEPFLRRDHYWDHLQDYHREDIQKRKKAINQDWLESRQIQPAWWRCSRCLVRVPIPKHNFKCPECKTTCEAKRREHRKRINNPKPSDESPSAETPKEDGSALLSKESSTLSQDSTDSPKLATLARKPSKSSGAPTEAAKKPTTPKLLPASKKNTGSVRQKGTGKKTAAVIKDGAPVNHFASLTKVKEE